MSTVWPSKTIEPHDHEVGWEYLFFAHCLEVDLAVHHVLFEGFVDGTNVAPAVVIDDPDRDLVAQLASGQAIIEVIPELFSSSSLERAFGVSGEAGNEDELRHLSQGIAHVFLEMLSWGQHLCSVAVDDDVASAYQALSRVALLPLQQILAFSHALSLGTARVVSEIRAGLEPSEPLVLTLTISVDDDAMAAFHDAVGRAFG